jgi:hypothetical protein
LKDEKTKFQKGFLPALKPSRSKKCPLQETKIIGNKRVEQGTGFTLPPLIKPNMQFSRIRSALNLSEKIVPDKPFIASVIAKQLGAGHEKTLQR